MTAKEILSLLQVGFSGFAAIMAVLAFRLIHLQVARKSPNASALKILKDFTRYTLFLSLVVILSMIVERGFDLVSRRSAAQEATEKSRALLTSKAAQDCREDLSELTGRESLRPEDELRQIMRLVQTACLPVMQEIESQL